MATKYATLKDSNGDTIYPQINTDSILDGSITGSKINWSTMARNSYSAVGQKTSNTTAVSVDLLSTSYTSKTGRVAITATAPFHTSRYTSGLKIRVNGTDKVTSPCNQQSYNGPTTAVWTGDIGTSAVTISTVVAGQDSGTNATVQQYCGYSLLIMDV